MVALQYTPDAPVSIPSCRPMTNPAVTILDALGLSVQRLKTDSGSVWNVFHKSAGWVGQIRAVAGFGYLASSHDGRITSHWSISSALTTLRDAASVTLVREAM